MFVKPKNSFLFFLILTLCHSAIAEEEDGETVSGIVKVSESLAFANEQLDAISNENLELKDRISEAQSIIVDLKRLAALKDKELVLIQQQLGTTPSAREIDITEEKSVTETHHPP